MIHQLNPTPAAKTPRANAARYAARAMLMRATVPLALGAGIALEQGVSRYIHWTWPAKKKRAAFLQPLDYWSTFPPAEARRLRCA